MKTDAQPKYGRKPKKIPAERLSELEELAYHEVSLKAIAKHFGVSESALNRKHYREYIDRGHTRREIEDKKLMSACIAKGTPALLIFRFKARYGWSEYTEQGDSGSLQELIKAIRSGPAKKVGRPKSTGEVPSGAA